MNDETPEPFDTVGDAPVEARIVAWVLGESSAFEAAELERLCEEKPELLVFRRRMRALHGLLTESEASEADHSWKLPPDKRKRLDEIFGDEEPVWLEPVNERRVRRGGMRAVMAIAACIVLSLVVFKLVNPSYESVATIEVRPRTGGMVVGFGQSGTPQSARMTPQFFGTEFSRIKSSNVLGKVVDQLNLDDRWKVSKPEAIAKLKKSVKIENLKGSDLISIRVKDSSQEDANRITRALATSYKDYRSEIELKDASKEMYALNKAVRDQEDKVEERRKVLATIVRTKGIIYKEQDSFYGQTGMDKDMESSKDKMKDEAIGRGLDAQDYVDAKRDFETDQELLQTMRLAQINKTIKAKMPDESIIIHEMPPADTSLVALNQPAPAARGKAAVPSSPAAPPVPAAKPAEGTAVGYAMSLAKERKGVKGDRMLAQRSRLAGQPKTEAPTAAMEPASAVPEIADSSSITSMSSLSGSALAGGFGREGADSTFGRSMAGETEPSDMDLYAAADSFAEPAARSSSASHIDGFEGRSDSDSFAPPSAIPSLSSRASLVPGQSRQDGVRPPAEEMPALAKRDVVGGIEYSLPSNVGYRQSKRNDADETIKSGSVTNGLRSGDQAITRNSINSILNNPDRNGADFVKPAEEVVYEGSVRSDAAQTVEHAEKIDEVRRGLYTAEGSFNLGNYDEASSEYEKVLRSDPYNSAARRGMEQVAQARTDYYRAAYDHTRAELLSQVDAAWELEVPADLAVAGKKMEANAKQPSLVETMDEVSASGDPYSTFSLNISDASFQLAKAALAKGERPDPAGIKPEQFYNAVDYGDPGPSADEPVAATIGQSAHPLIPGRNLVRVALRTASVGRAASQPLRLTLLVDQSGSMVREDRRAAMDKALHQLGGLLTENDVVSIVGFSRTPHLLSDRLSGSEGGKLSKIINQAASEGGTNLEEAMKLGATIAERQQLAGAQNRIVLFTDGAANLGNADPDRLAKQVTALRQKGIAFDIAGIGADGLNDRLLGDLARNGNGRYYVVGDGQDDRFAKQLAGAFRPAAENVKVQVILNPMRVGNYKLLGFEKDRLKTEDFRNDSVDAAELAANEAGVALYQVETLPEGKGEIGEVSVRFRDMASGEMVERSWTIPYEASAPAFDRATPAMQLAGLSLLAAEKLRGGPMAGAIDFRQLAKPLAEVRRFYQSSARVGEMLQVIDAIE